jgi:hypothetical protein
LLLRRFSFPVLQEAHISKILRKLRKARDLEELSWGT